MLKSFRFMLHVVALVLSWLGVWISERPIEHLPCHCNCTCSIEKIECPDLSSSWSSEILKASVFLILGLAIGTFQVIQAIWLGLRGLLVSCVQSGPGDELEKQTALVNESDQARPREVVEGSQQELARHQLALLRKRRAVAWWRCPLVVESFCFMMFLFLNSTTKDMWWLPAVVAGDGM